MLRSFAYVFTSIVTLFFSSSYMIPNLGTEFCIYRMNWKFLSFYAQWCHLNLEKENVVNFYPIISVLINYGFYGKSCFNATDNFQEHIGIHFALGWEAVSS